MNARKDEGTEGRKDDAVVVESRSERTPRAELNLAIGCVVGVLSGLYRRSCWFWDRVRNVDLFFFLFPLSAELSMAITRNCLARERIGSKMSDLARGGHFRGEIRG